MKGVVIIMKLPLINVKVLVILMIVIFITIFSVACVKKIEEKPSEYLIDIKVVNKTNLKIDSLELYEKGEDWEYLITRAYENEDGYVHFAVSFNKNSFFYITGYVDKKEVEKYEFNLDGFEHIYKEQILYIYLIKNENEEFELRKESVFE